MATIFMEPTETGGLGPYLTATSASVGTSQVAGSWSTRSIYLSAATGGVWYSLGASYTTLYGQFRVFTNDNYTGAAEDFFGFNSPNDTRQCSIGVNSAGKLVAYRGTTTTTLGTGTTSLLPNSWYLIQFKVVISDTVGEFVVKLDGVTEINLSSQDTRSDGATENVDRIGCIGFAGDAWMDDVIINDGTGSVNNTYPDSLGIEALFPNAAGDNTGLTRGGSDSGSNYGQVDEIPANDATDYVYDSVIDDYDIYNLPATQWSTVASVALALRAQKSDAGAANIAHMLKIDTNADGSADELDTGADIALSTSWTHHIKIYDRQPDNSGDTNWSASKVNALQVGAKVR